MLPVGNDLSKVPDTVQDQDQMHHIKAWSPVPHKAASLGKSGQMTKSLQRIQYCKSNEADGLFGRPIAAASGKDHARPVSAPTSPSRHSDSESLNLYPSWSGPL